MSVLKGSASWLRKGFYKAESAYGFGQPTTISQVSSGKDVQQAFKQDLRPPCSVCAKAALFLSRIRVKGGISGQDFLDIWGCDPSEALWGIFTPSQLNSIEEAFEAFEGFGDASDAHKAFYNRHKTPETRMTTIMTQIARTGRFDPKKDPSLKSRARKVVRPLKGLKEQGS